MPNTSQISNVHHGGQYGVALHVPNMSTGDSLGVRLFRWCEARQYSALFYSSWYYIPQRVTVTDWWHIMLVLFLLQDDHDEKLYSVRTY